MGEGTRSSAQVTSTSTSSVAMSEAENRHNVAPRQRATVIHRDSDSENGGAMIEEMCVLDNRNLG